MSIDQVKNLNFAELVIYRKDSPETASKDFILAFNENDSTYSTITYSEFYQKSREMAALIQLVRREQGVSEADSFNVGILMENRPEFLYIQAGCAFTNSTLVALNTLRTGEALAHDVNFTDVHLLFTDHHLAAAVEAAVPYLSNLPERWIMMTDDSEKDQRFNSINQQLKACSSPDLVEERPLRSENTAMIIFTSGTTGPPKGIKINWKKLMDVGFNSIKALSYTAEDTGYICMPLCHSNSMYLNYMPALVSGARIGLRNRFSAGKFVADITACQATVWNCVGKPVTYVLNTIKDEDYSSLPLRIAISTGTTADEQERFIKAFGMDAFVEAYGSTETGAITVKTPDASYWSVGKMNPTKPFLILSEWGDKDGRRQELKAGAIGEIAVDNQALGASAFQEYYRNSEATKKRFYQHDDGKNYYLTGDLGKLDEEKNLYFMGRTGEWYRKLGENRSDAAVEELLSRFQDVVTLVAFGMPDATSQEDFLVVVIETETPGDFDINGFVDFARKQGKEMVPDFIRVTNAMPKTSTEKIIKSAVKKTHLKRLGIAAENDLDVIFQLTRDSIEGFDQVAYKRLIDSYLPQSRERLNAFLSRMKAEL